jgi:hypothetical protein
MSDETTLVASVEETTSQEDVADVAVETTDETVNEETTIDEAETSDAAADETTEETK